MTSSITRPFFSMLLLPMLTGTVVAEDLWEARAPSRSFLFIDSQARHVGDLLTMIISEETDLDQSDDRALSKDSAAGGSFDLNGEAGGDLGSQAGNAGLDFNGSSNRKFDGSTSFRSARQISDRITVTVMDVLPNGNLVVSGSRLIHVGRDQRELIVSGVVRSIDLNADNTVPSRFVSELRVRYATQGPDAKFTNQGWFSRTTNLVWPF